MPSRLFPLALVAALLAGESAAAAPAAAPVTLVAVLSGAAEPAGGDPDGSGRAEITLDTARLRLCYALTATGIAPASAAGIHRGASTDRPVVRLVAPRDGESRNCVELTAYEANEIVRRPENFYVSVRNAEHPAGALRGQLQR